jgi:hypothetical protein
MQIHEIKVHDATYNSVSGLYTQGDEVTDIVNNVGEDEYLASSQGSMLTVLQDYTLELDQSYIIYFTMWFNPEYSYDVVTGTVQETNSNAYSGSFMEIEHIAVSLDQIIDEIPDWGD